jgi:quercetin dioxygenase-like cupin family protein
MAELLQPDREKKFLLDPFGDWVDNEGIPRIFGLGADLKTIETKPWARIDAKGASVELDGRGDFISIFLIELDPGGKTSPQTHLYEEVIYVISGHGSTTVEDSQGNKHTFEWGPKSLFALPLNCKHQHFNGSGTEPARLSSTTTLCVMMNLLRNEEFIFNNDFHFPDREGESNYFSGEGTYIPHKPGRNAWETNFVPDVGAFELKSWAERGGGSSNMKFILADNTLHTHSSEMPVGTYKKGHRHPADFHVFCVHGTGYTLLWYDFDEKVERIDWEHGVVFPPPDGMFHQHFNTSPTPARYLAIGLGSMRYPFTEAKLKHWMGAVDTSLEEGGNQIEYEQQDPRIHQIFLEELAKNGVKSGMGKYIDESKYNVPEAIPAE